MRKVLIIAYHFPPIQGSSGYLRTLKFARYLPEHGFEPVVLTVVPSAYPASNPELLRLIPEGLEVHRAFALDASRHLAIGGRYPSFLTLPDRFLSWLPAGLLAGLRLARSRKIDAVFSTYPVATAHLLGSLVSRLARLPWVADFRDPMWDAHTQARPAQLRARKAIERSAARRAARIVVCTPGMREMYLKRYPFLGPSEVANIANGYDEEDFAGLNGAAREEGPVRLTHAGLLDPVDRDPVPFLRAVRRLRDAGRMRPGGVRVDLLAPGHGAAAQAVASLGLEDVVTVHPPVPYSRALAAMAESDVLLLFQGPSCDSQVPAKLYEYMRIGKPVLAMAPAEGETGRLVAATGCGEVVPPDDEAAIAGKLDRWLSALADGGALPRAERPAVEKFSRRAQAGQLAAVLSEALADPRSKNQMRREK